jgi:hypothetical protein
MKLIEHQYIINYNYYKYNILYTILLYTYYYILVPKYLGR